MVNALNKRQLNHFLGDVGLIKVVSEFLFRHPKCQFLYPRMATSAKSAHPSGPHLACPLFVHSHSPCSLLENKLNVEMFYTQAVINLYLNILQVRTRAVTNCFCLLCFSKIIEQFWKLPSPKYRAGIIVSSKSINNGF